MPLTVKHRRFVEEYLLDLNATQAAIRAGYSAKTAYSSGQRLLRNVEVSAEVERLQRERSARTGVDADGVIAKLAAVALFDPRTLFRADGTVKPPAEWDDATAAAVSGVEARDGTHRVKLHDKLRALELLGKHLGLFKERVEVSGPAGGPIPVIYIPHNHRDPAAIGELPGESDY